MQERTVPPPQIILLAGPTASGKSRLAMELAATTGGVIVNADSMQVYSELRILSARPSEEDEARAPHRLYGHVGAATRYSVGGWLADVAPALAEAAEAGRSAIVVGGTGLYFKALTEGLAPVPAIAPAVREHVRLETAGVDTAALHARLGVIDPEDAAVIRPSDRARIVRALEVFTATGRSLATWKVSGEAGPLVPPSRARRWLLIPDRGELHRRISERAEAMMRAGAIGEARALGTLGLDPVMPAMKAIGVRELLAHERGDLSLDEAVATIKTETRRYAKRQMTWFRNQMAGWEAVDVAQALDLARAHA